jgi:poly [ADP-ribose] polymerase
MPIKIKGDKTRDITEQERNSAIRQERLICVDVSDNNCKFWHGLVLANGDAFCEFGRVDKTRQHEYYAYGNVSEAEHWLSEKSREKQNKRGGKASYTPQRTIPTSGSVIKHSGGSGAVNKSELKTIAAQQIKGDPETKKLVTWLADVNIHQITANTQITYNVNTGAFSTSLGLVTPDGISEARTVLNDLSDYVVKRDWENPSYKRYLSNYLRIVPQNVGMRAGWHQTFFMASDALQKQNDILDALEAALQQPSGGTATPEQKTEQVFNVELKVVSEKAVIDRIRAKYGKDRGSHSDVRDYDVHQVWDVHIKTVRDAFSRDGAKLSNIMELWHGTRCAHLMSILKGGLQIPPASAPHVCGRMFGDGIYTSSQSQKSIRYAVGAWQGSGDTSRVFMFLCSVGMGKYYTPNGYQSGSFRIPPGYDSCWAKGGHSGVQHDEMITYRCSQVDLRYLIEFR